MSRNALALLLATLSTAARMANASALKTNASLSNAEQTSTAVGLRKPVSAEEQDVKMSAAWPTATATRVTAKRRAAALSTDATTLQNV